MVNFVFYEVLIPNVHLFRWQTSDPFSFSMEFVCPCLVQKRSLTVNNTKLLSIPSKRIVNLEMINVFEYNLSMD